MISSSSFDAAKVNSIANETNIVKLLRIFTVYSTAAKPSQDNRNCVKKKKKDVRKKTLQ